MNPPRILIVAGSDSGGGAGIQADIKTVTMLGGHAMTALTAITAQNTLGVDAVMAVPTALVLQQIDMVAGDLGVDAIKIGMIGSAETVDAVAGRLEKMAGVPVVFDPVMVATSGSSLADAATIAAFEGLMRCATLVTPNLPELAALVGRPVDGEEEAAAVELFERFGCAVLAKGGHAAGEMITDLLVGPAGTVRHVSDRVATRHTHGTGCTLASGVATGLGAGLALEPAVERAIAYVQAAIAAAPGYGGGHGPLGHALDSIPFDHLRPATTLGERDVDPLGSR